MAKVHRVKPRIIPADRFAKMRPWKTVELNPNLISATDFLLAFRDKGITVGADAQRIIRSTVGKTPIRAKKFDLLKLTMKKLTGKNEGDFFEAAGFAEPYDLFDSIELWLNLRLQYLNQPRGECLYTAGPHCSLGGPLSKISEHFIAIDHDVSVGNWIYGARYIDTNGKLVTFPADSLWLVARPRK